MCARERERGGELGREKMWFRAYSQKGGRVVITVEVRENREVKESDTEMSVQR